MAKLKILNTKGDAVGDIELDNKIWSIEPNDAVLHNAIVLAMSSLRQGTHKVKNRSEVSGGGKKPWRQKGTGRARQGSIRSPQWVGGGVVFGPTPRDYSKKMNKKERKLALRSAVSYKLNGKDLILLENLNLDAPKTKDMVSILTNLKLTKKVLFVTDEILENAFLAARNLDRINFVSSSSLNVLNVVSADKLVILKDAISNVEEVLK